jgi:hypothetical protein
MRSRLGSRFAHVPEIEVGKVGRPKFRFRNPIVSGMLEIITQHLYDYYEVAVATPVTSQVLFTIPIGGQYTPAGGTAFNKTKLHTNLQQQSQLQAPNKHLTRAVGVWFRGDVNPTDLNLFQGNTLLRFIVNDKEYLIGLVGKMPGGGGPFVSAAAATTVAATTQSFFSAANGYPDARNLYTLEHDGVQIEQQQAFQVELNPLLVQGGVGFTTQALAPAGGQFAGSGIKAWANLEGTLARAVQ